MAEWKTEVFENEYLPADATDVHAVVTVTCQGAGIAGQSGAAAEIIIVDTSGSMSSPRTKIVSARAAAAAAIDELVDGIWFAVISGDNAATVVYPDAVGMAQADERTRADAKAAVQDLEARGGTAIGSWLDAATALFSTVEATQRHAILLTDGKDETETPQELQDGIDHASGVFQCDCRGVGANWDVNELRGIATALLGSVDIVVDPAGLAADFEELMRGAMSKQLPDVALRVWTPQTAAVKFVKQVAPDIHDLTERRVATGAQAGDYPTGAWAAGESRDYHVAITVNPANLGQEMLAGRVSLVATSAANPAGEVLGQGLIRVTWTDDEALSTRINGRVAGYTGQAELAAAIQEGLEANKRGDEEVATARLGRAVALAHQAGNEDMARLLAGVVDVVDEATGTVRLKRKVDAAAEMALDTRSTKTVRVRKG